jgi:hypothetical protein
MNSFATTFSPAPSPPLCDARGHLTPEAVGWSPRPLLDCALPSCYGRRKRWNHWCITSPDWALSLTVADFDYVGYGAVHFLDLHSGQTMARTQLRPFARGCRLPDTPQESHEFCHPHLNLRVDEQPGRLRLSLCAPSIGQGKSLQVALDIQRPTHLDSMNLAAPLPGGGFHACSRQLGLPARGSVQLGDQQYPCTPGQSFAALDFGRGIWPLHSRWTHAAFSAPGGIAGSFGSGWAEHCGLNENALWFGGELLPMNSTVCIEPPAESSQDHWRLNSADDSVALIFSPQQQHQIRPQLGPFYTDTQQWFGRFDGTLRGPAGECVPVSGALGWLGETRTRW